MRAHLTASASPAKPLLSLAGAAGIAVPFAIWTANIVFGLMRPGYNFLVNAGSELGMKGTSNALFFNVVNFYVAGTLVLVFAAGLWAADKGRASRVAAAILALGGVAMVLSGYFTMDPGSQAATKVHQNLGLPVLLGFPMAALLMTRPLKGARGTMSLAVGVLVVLIMVGFLVLSAVSPLRFRVGDSMGFRVSGVDFAIGTVQRLFGGLLAVWFVTVGLWLRML